MLYIFLYSCIEIAGAQAGEESTSEDIPLYNEFEKVQSNYDLGIFTF